MGKPGPDWTPAEDFVLSNSLGMSAERLCELLPGRSIKAIQQRRVRLSGSPKYRKVWSPEEDVLLGKMVREGKTLAMIAEALGRPRNAVKHRWARVNGSSWQCTYVEPVVPPTDPWEALPPDAFKDIKLKADTRFMTSRPQDRTLGGVGSAML